MMNNHAKRGLLLCLLLSPTVDVSAGDTFEIGLGVGACNITGRDGTHLCTKGHVEHLYGKWSFYEDGGFSLSYQLHHFSRAEEADINGGVTSQTGELNYSGLYLQYSW